MHRLESRSAAGVTQVALKSKCLSALSSDKDSGEEDNRESELGGRDKLEDNSNDASKGKGDNELNPVTEHKLLAYIDKLLHKSNLESPKSKLH